VRFDDAEETVDLMGNGKKFLKWKQQQYAKEFLEKFKIMISFIHIPKTSASRIENTIHSSY
jgi:hypothetical protein